MSTVTSIWPVLQSIRFRRGPRAVGGVAVVALAGAAAVTADALHWLALAHRWLSDVLDRYAVWMNTAYKVDRVVRERVNWLGPGLIGMKIASRLAAVLGSLFEGASRGAQAATAWLLARARAIL